MAKADAEQAANDTGLSDATDTSTDDLVDDRTLGDDWDNDPIDDADDDDLESDSDDDSAATDEDDADDSDDAEEVDESTDDSSEEEDAEDSDSDESDADDDSPEGRKRRNAAAAQARIEAKKAREEAAAANAEAERLRQEREKERLQAFLDEAGDDETERKNRELAVKEHQLQEREITQNRQSLQVGIERAVASIDLFRTGTDVQKAALADSLDDFEALYVRKDAQGRPLEVRGNVAEYLTKQAERIKKLAGEGVKTQEKQKSRQKARTMATPRRAPVKAKSDPMMDGFDEEANRW